MKVLDSQTFVDKRDWPPGPWHDEPDRVYWVDEATGLDCLIVRAHVSGSLCGYVGVPAGHPASGCDYSTLDVSVHGGLTYSARCDEGGLICHTPASGRPDDVWWLGFDCGHAFDVMPAIVAKLIQLGSPTAHRMLGPPTDEEWPDDLLPRPRYCDLAYVTEQVESLARQLKALA